MKKLSIFIFLLLLAISSTNFAYADGQNPCISKPDITIPPGTKNPFTYVKNILNNYDQPQYDDRKTDNTYCLNFNITPLTAKTNINIVVKGSYNLYISGIIFSKLDSVPEDVSLLTIENNQTGTVTLANSQFTDVKNGIKVTGTGKTEIDHVVIKGKANTEGTCLELAASGAIVAASDISNCQMGISVAGNNSKILGSDIYGNGEGIRIAADNTYLGAGSAETFATEANQIHANGTGIHIVSGSSNKFPFNSVYENQTYGILYDQIS